MKKCMALLLCVMILFCTGCGKGNTIDSESVSDVVEHTDIMETQVSVQMSVEPTKKHIEEVTVESTEVATMESTEESTEEATEESTEEATEESTEEATKESTVEATEETTKEATEETTKEATEESTKEATEESTKEATEESTKEPTEGVVTDTDVPLDSNNSNSNDNALSDNSAMTEYEIFINMSPAEQQEYMMSFNNIEEFFSWYNEEKERYELENPSIEIDGDVVDLDKIAGN